jgi:hypothetical protein
MPPEPINWATISPQSQGQTDRHHRAAPTPLVMWKCPACASEQSGDLKYGCQACGSGRPGYRAEAKKPEMKPRDPGLTTISMAFMEWAAEHDVQPVDRALCFEAFTAGVKYIMASSSNGRTPGFQPGNAGSTPADATLPLAGTPESRTLAAALTYFLDHVLSESPEECEDGTWITPEQAKALIQQLESGT